MLGLRTTIYIVSDLNAAKIWYANAFNVEAYFDEPYYVGFNIGGFELGLQPDKNSTSKKTITVISYWGVTNIRQSHKRLIEIGAKSHEEPTNVGGELMVSSVFDPWGNVIGLIYNPSFQIAL